jgi:murein DD-endopeptidase MepM/ murein hydrolase activator NlpD
MKKEFYLLLLATSLAVAVFAQPPVKQPNGGGDYRSLAQVKDEISPEQRTAIVHMLQQNETRLRSEGLLQTPANPGFIAFSWPIKQALNYNDNGFYGISNYVDENPSFPNAILDYNCGNRSYDLSSGYNHAGTDIFTWPFPLQKMARNSVQIIAAAAGTIIAKTDGNFDQNCAFCSGPCTWNAVYVMHADGSVAWYGHMKSGSLTTKAIGQTVTTGEYLGVVGSSGNSTGPHLHFEVYTNSSYTQLVDPWGGPCNNLNGSTSWWDNQQPYYVPTLNKIMTHSAPPGTGNCPGSETPNEKINFANGETLYLGSYYRDQQPGQQSVHTLYRPDNTVQATWTQNFTTYYSASWWWYSYVLPNPAATGTWRYEIVYNGTQKVFTQFVVNSGEAVICPGNDNMLTSNIAGSVSYQWQVNTGSGFTNIGNGANYAGVTNRQLQLINLPSSFYGYQYRCLVDGASFSNTIGLKFASYWKGAVSKAWEDPANWGCGNIPDANTDVVISGNTNTPEVSSNAVCRSVNLNPGTAVTVKTGWKLDVKH